MTWLRSIYLIIGGVAYGRQTLIKTANIPMKMDDKIIDHSEKEKYLGDVIHEKGCAASISETINERTRKLISKCDDIIKLAENPIMGGLGNSTSAFKLYYITVNHG